MRINQLINLQCKAHLFPLSVAFMFCVSNLATRVSVKSEEEEKQDFEFGLQ